VPKYSFFPNGCKVPKHILNPTMIEILAYKHLEFNVSLFCIMTKNKEKGYYVF
jgi:hypothetical protein